MNLPYGYLAGNSRISLRINQLLPLLAEEDQRKFLKRFRSEAGEQAAHTFRELILGVFLVKNGFVARYEVLIDGKTPDWTLYGDSKEVLAVVEQITFHQAREIDDEMNQAVRAGSAWCGWLPNNVSRLYQRLVAKAEAYEKLVNQHAASSIVSIFGEFNAVVETDELEETLLKAYGGGIFTQAPSLSGVIYFQETAGIYGFKYFSNPSATCPLHVSEGQV